MDRSIRMSTYVFRDVDAGFAPEEVSVEVTARPFESAESLTGRAFCELMAAQVRRSAVLAVERVARRWNEREVAAMEERLRLRELLDHDEREF